MSEPVRRLVAGASISVVLALVFALAGCGSAGSSDSVTSGSAGLPSQDVDHWVMPVDEYLPPPSGLTDYAENVLVSECMSAAGYIWEVPAYDVDAPLPVTENSAGRTLFNESIAAERGYLPASTTQANAEAQEVFASAELPDGSDETYSECLASVRADQLPLGSAQAMSFAASLGSAADQAALLDDAVLTAASAWRSCMAPVGVSDLPDSPAEMPTSTLKESFGRANAETDVDLGSMTPTAYEIEVATADAACRESSGWTQARYDAEWSRQAAAVQENADALERIRAENEETEARALAVLAERGLG